MVPPFQRAAMKLGLLQSHSDPELSRAKAGQKDQSGVHTCMVFFVGLVFAIGNQFGDLFCKPVLLPLFFCVKYSILYSFSQ